MPAPTFPPSGDPRRPRYWSAEYESPVLLRALAAFGARTGADPARVLPAVRRGVPPGPAAMTAFKHGYFDAEQLNELTAAIGRERGVELDIASFLNDRRAARAEPRDPAAADPASADPASAAASRFTGCGRRNDPVERLFLHVDDAPDAVLLRIEADTRGLSPAQIEEIVRGVEEAAVAAAAQPGLSSGIAGS